MTVDEALRRGAQRLSDAGVADAPWQAERLLRHVLAWDRAQLHARAADALAPADEARFETLLAARAARRPLQHLTGSQAFWKHEFLVTPDVLIPRPETELLVEATLELMRGLEAPTVVDVGTGSGCIAISIAAERPDAVVHAIDLSPATLAVAAENAKRNAVAERIHFHQGDLLAPVERAGPFDLVVSNPPYVDPADLPGLAPEVRNHEPRLALFAPEGPYGIYRRLARQAAHALRPGGHVAVEVGRGMADEVARILAAAGLQTPDIHRDLQDIARVVTAGTRPAAP